VWRFGFPDERVVEVDHGVNVLDESNRVTRGPCDLIATDAALYIYSNGSEGPNRFSYDEIAGVYVPSQRLRLPAGLFGFANLKPGVYRPGPDDVRTARGELHLFEEVTRSRGRLPRYVRQQARGQWRGTAWPHGPGLGPPSGDRDPRRPKPTEPPAALSLNETSDE
jgi:hypothetical protein